MKHFAVTTMVCESIHCCYSCRENGCWRACCPCIADFMSFNKFMSIIPFWPIVAVLLFVGSGTFILLGLELVTKAAGISLDPLITLFSQLTGVVLTLLNAIFAYSVCSNKMRVHNTHCMAETCRGYRIKDSENCCTCLLRIVCKAYNLIMKMLSWLATGLSIGVTTVLLAPLAGVVLFLVTLCQNSIFLPAIQSILDELVFLQASRLSSTQSYIAIANGTTASALCDAKGEMYLGGMYMLVCAPLFIAAQVVMVVSYHVVAEVRHAPHSPSRPLQPPLGAAPQF